MIARSDNHLSPSHSLHSQVAAAHPEDYRALGNKPITPQPKKITVSAMSDTGCQSCLASIKVIRHLGLCEDDLIPVKSDAHACCKQQWNKDTQCHHFEIHQQIPMWTDP